MKPNKSKKIKQIKTITTTESFFRSGGRINIPQVLCILQSVKERGNPADSSQIKKKKDQENKN